MLGLVALAGLVLGLWATSSGLYATPDSASYLGRAEQIRGGAGFTLPFLPDGEHVTREDLEAGTTSFKSSHFPPLYSVALSLGPPTTSARLVAVACLAANLLLIATIVGRLSNWHPLALALAAVLAIADVEFAMVHTAALSEPLAMTFSLGALLALAEAFRRDRPVPWVIGFTVLGSLALLTRYAAVSVLIAGALAIVLQRRWSLRSRLTMVAGIGLAVVPTLAWMVLGGGGARSFAVHGLRASQGDMLGQAAIDWLAPQSLPGDVRALVAAIVASTLVAAWYVMRREPVDPDETTPDQPGRADLLRLLWLYLGAQVAVQIGTLLVLDVGTETRLMVPAHVLFVVAVVSLTGLGRAKTPRLVPRLAGCAIALIVITQLGVVHATFSHSGTEGRYAGLPSLDTDPRAAELRSALRGLPPDTMIVSNAPGRLYLLTGHHAVTVPSRWFSTTGQANPDYVEELALEGEALHRRGGVAIIFTGAAKTRTWLPDTADLIEAWRLTRAAETESFVILTSGDRLSVKASTPQP